LVLIPKIDSKCTVILNHANYKVSLRNICVPSHRVASFLRNPIQYRYWCENTTILKIRVMLTSVLRAQENMN